MDLTSIGHEALKLPTEERARLVELLLRSMDEPGETGFEEEWLIGVRRRAEQLDRGDVSPVPAEDVRRKARELLR